MTNLDMACVQELKTQAGLDAPFIPKYLYLCKAYLYLGIE
jgi:hypothetical protein